MNNLPKNQTTKGSFVKIGEAAQKLGVSIDTLRRWEKAGKIETTRTPGGTRLYSTSILSDLTETPKKYQRNASILASKNLISEESPAKSSTFTTVEDLLNISRLEGNKLYQTPTTDQKWEEYVDERIVKPVEVSVFSEAEISNSPMLLSHIKKIPRNFLGHKIFTLTAFSGVLAVIFLAFLIVARASNFSIFNLNNLNQTLASNQVPKTTSNLNSDVLAAETGFYYLDFNTDLIVEGDLAVGGTINGLILTPNNDGFSVSGGTTSRKLTVINGDVTLDQDVSTQGSPSFQAIDLSTTTNQITMGGAGTLTWTPTGTQTITFPNATGTVLLDSATQTITNKTLSGSSNTFSSIPNSALSNSKVTVTAGTNLSGGGDVSLGSSTTLNLAGDISLATVTATSYLSLSQTTAPTTVTDKLYNIGGSLYWNGTDLSASGGAIPSINGLSGALTIAGGGINTVGAAGSTITITGTEADTLATVTARGATTSDAVTFSSTINSNTFTSTALTFSGASPSISAATAGTNINLDAGTSGKVVIAGTSTGDVDIAGGSTLTGCTVNNTTGNLTCTGDISGGSTGTAGFWTRAGTSLSPATAGDSITTTGGISTTGSGTLSIAGTATFSSTINSNTFTSTALTFAGTTPVISAATAATDISLNPGVGGNVQLAGGSGSFGCTVNDTTGDLTCTGAIASGGTGVVGYWQTDGGSPPTLSPATTGGHVTTSGNIYTSGTGAITSGGLLTGQTGLTVSGGVASLNASSNFATNINTGTSTGAISIGNSAAGAINLQSGAASTFAAPANTATAFRFTDGTNAYQTLDTRNTLSGVSAHTFTAGTAPTIASASNAEFTTLTTTPPTITLTGTTQVTQQMDSILFNAPTITDSSAVTIDKAATLTINGAPISGASGSVTLTDSYGLKINTASVDTGTGTVTNAYGAYIEAPTGATNNYGLTITADSITNGKGLNLTSTSTGLTTGNMFNLDWSPTGSTNIYATGDLMSVGTGNAYAFVGNLFNVKSQGSSVFSVSDTVITASIPASFTAPGDVSIAYDINMTNPTASYIKSNAPLYITAGKVFNSSDLTLTTYNQGSIVFAKDFTGSAVTNYLSQINGTDSTSNANTNYGLYSSIVHTGNAAKTGIGLYSTLSTSSTTADTLIAADLATTTSGVITTGTRNIYGLRTQPASTAASTGGTTNVYGVYSKPGGVVGAGGTINVYGLYVANGTMDATGTSNNYGLYLESPTGADTNQVITTAAISGTGTAAVLTTGAISSTGATAYQINLGAISGANATSHTGINIGNISGTTAAAAGITLGTLTGGTSTNYQISTGTLTGIASATNAQLNLGASVGAASATTYGINVGAISGAGTASYGINIGANSSTATTNYGMNIGAVSGAGTTNYGLYVGSVSGAGTNYAAYFAGGNVNVQSLTASSAVYTDGSKNLTSTAPTSGALGFWQRNGTSVAPATITDSVGIGTTSPVGMLDITDTSNTAASLSLTNNTATTIGAAANTLGVIDLQSTSLTTGNFMNMELNALSSGRGINITSTSTALSSGNLFRLDWSPSGSTNIYATGDLMSIGTGNAYAFAGNLFNVKSQGSSVFSVSDSAVTANLPASFTAPGDVSIAYDINFTNPTASYIKSAAPLYLAAGETFNSSDLVLSTYNQGSVILSKDFVGSAVTNYVSQISATDATANANTNYGLYSNLTFTGNAAKTGVGLYSTLTSSSTTADTLIAADLATSTTGIITTGTRNIYGLRSQPTSTAASTGGTTNVYGGYMKSGGVVGVGGTINSYGMYIANGTMDTTGLSTNTGLYVETPSGADTNYAAIFAGGNVGIGTGTPNAVLNVVGGDGGATATGAALLLQNVTTNATNKYGTIASAHYTNANAPFALIWGDGRNTTNTVNIGGAAGGLNAATAITFYTAANNNTAVGTERMRIDSAGNVGIGTTAPGSPLSVNGGISAGTYFATAAPANSFIISGDIGIGTTAPARSLETTGSIRMGPLITGGGGAAAVYRDANGDLADATSSILYKTDVTPYSSVLDKVMELEAVNFKWNEKTSTPGMEDFGMIAESVNTVIPDLVIFDNDGVTPHGLKYEKMGLIALKAIQELNNKVNSYNLTLDESGNVVLPNVKIDKLVLSETNIDPNNQNYFDVATKFEDTNSRIKNLEDVIASAAWQSATNGKITTDSASLRDDILGLSSEVDSLKAEIASLSARLQTAESTNSGQIASNSASVILNGVKDLPQSSTSASVADSSSSANVSSQNDISLNLTPPEILLATGSAQLVDLTVTSEATFSGRLIGYDLSVQNIFKSLGDTFLGNTTIAGDFSVDGTLSLTGNSISTLDDLHIQNGPLAGNVDFFNGQVIIDKTGKLVAQEITTNKLVILSGSEGSSTLGSSTIPANTLEIPIFTSAVTGNSKIFLTPTSPTGGQAVILGEIVPNTGFVVKLDHTFGADIKFNWLIIDSK